MVTVVLEVRAVVEHRRTTVMVGRTAVVDADEGVVRFGSRSLAMVPTGSSTDMRSTSISGAVSVALGVLFEVFFVQGCEPFFEATQIDTGILPLLHPGHRHLEAFQLVLVIENDEHCSAFGKLFGQLVAQFARGVLVGTFLLQIGKSSLKAEEKVRGFSVCLDIYLEGCSK